MKAFHIKGDKERLYFQNSDRVPDYIEYENIMNTLISKGVEIEERFSAPDCDVIRCRIEDKYFSVVKDASGDGTFIYADDIRVMNIIENFFEMI